MSLYLAPFRPLGATVNIVVGATTSNIEIDRPANGDGSVRLVNAGAETVFVNFGNVGITASIATSFPMLPNSVETFFLEKSDSYIAAIANAPASTLYCTFGVGA